MYDWQQNRSMTSPLVAGQCVVLNEQWSGYNYLKREFGKFFPAYVNEVKGDLIRIGDKQIFARQVLKPA